MLKRMMWFVIIAFGLYCIYAALFYIFQRDIIYPGQKMKDLPHPASLKNGKIIWLKVGKDFVETWYFPAKGTLYPVPVLFIAHGNASFIEAREDAVAPAREMGFSVVLTEYPGYGRTPGSPSQESITKAFITSYDYYTNLPEINKKRVVFLGRSLGGGVVCSLARHRSAQAIILMSTFRSVGKMAHTYLLPGFLAKDPFDNQGFLEIYKGPLMLVHGMQDNVIPFSHARILHKIRPDARFITYDTLHNNTPPDWDEFWQQVKTFLIDNEII